MYGTDVAHHVQKHVKIMANMVVIQVDFHMAHMAAMKMITHMQHMDIISTHVLWNVYHNVNV